MLVYDLTDVDSLKEAEEWYTLTREQVNIEEITIALVGNKVDDLDRQEIRKADADALAKRVGAKFHLQVSAKTNDNIEKMFKEIGIKMIEADPEVSVLQFSSSERHSSFNSDIFFSDGDKCLVS